MTHDNKIIIPVLFLFIVAAFFGNLAHLYITANTQSIGVLLEKQQESAKTIAELKAAVVAVNGAQKLTVTCYTATKNECDSTPDKTAIMRKPVVGRTVAVSRDLMRHLGRFAYIEGMGVYVVEDLMNSRYKGSVDILVGTKKEAFSFGRQTKRVVFFD